MAIAYEPKLLVEAAERLYSEARLIALSYALRGLLVCGFGGFITTLFLRNAETERTLLVSAGVGAVIGLVFGSGKGFALRLEAQKVLCLLQTEINSRKA